MTWRDRDCGPGRVSGSGVLQRPAALADAAPEAAGQHFAIANSKGTQEMNSIIYIVGLVVVVVAVLSFFGLR